MQSTKLDFADLKVWFVGANTSRNFPRVSEMTRCENILRIINSSDTVYTLNWDNITMIEEIHE